MNEFEYRVSIIVPVYNVGKWIMGSVESLLTQTIPQKDFEILLVDDGSTDDSPTVCDIAQNVYPGVVKAFHKPN